MCTLRDSCFAFKKPPVAGGYRIGQRSVQGFHGQDSSPARRLGEVAQCGHREAPGSHSIYVVICSLNKLLPNKVGAAVNTQDCSQALGLGDGNN
ncbi:hypothetical protein J1605_007023 [Eschrichtius robustus]|uniref:Uncharacterized protein n=1 Tax=Eschrichtius robustus TaxID=9764 RepID=A0AB34GY42_ESCRO|nr:hypothetical protein J1605_007023 [Eschrichtius robustus]